MMTAITQNDGGRRSFPWRIVGWSVATLVLLAPLVAMQFTDEVSWSIGDFVIAGALLASAGGLFELAARASADSDYRLGAGAAIATAFLLVWVNGAVGIIGNESNPANMMFAGVLAIGIIGAAIAGFQAGGMARALVATALAQILVAVIALVVDFGAEHSASSQNVLIATVFFTGLWFTSAWLFRRSSRNHSRVIK